MLSRRFVLASSALLALPAHAQDVSMSGRAVDMKKVLEASSLPLRQLGKDDAPITLVEYASLTCGHCAAFHTETMPKLKEKYVDSGKLRVIYRHFVLNMKDMAASMVLQSAPPEKYFPLLDVLFKTQEQWAFGNDSASALLAIFKQAGMTEEQFEAALKNAEIYEKLAKDRDLASNEFKIDSTPTLIINGVLSAGAKSIEDLDKLFAGLLKL